MAESEDGVSRPAGPSTAPISFSFSRTAARRRLADRGDDPGAAPEEKEFLKTVEGRKLHSGLESLSHVSKTSSGPQNGTASMRKGSELPTRQGAEEKRKHLPDRQDEPPAKSEKAASRRQHWLHRDLRVRFVDKLYKRGQYYNTKMIIEDVLSPDTCVCRTDEGQVLDGIREDMLETLIPKVQGKRVMVVLGPQAGRVGHLLSWDREQSQAVVQLRRENRVVELHYDAVCEYIGPTDSDED
ncbi:G-patch domain and KOW motifs-containing protein [Myotis lucifugus]|uniref:G-patch domain and KOW motifs-containing protein n=1 Tax=Myotis lucifugus TaxID=59463 RepID=UPI0003C48E5C|nr:G-patch domain and KOW motifs-containing protein [Myotis lucifugus]